MSAEGYLVNGLLVLMVVRQIRWTKLGPYLLVLPIVLVGAAAAEFLRSVPTGGNDVVFEVVLASAGAVLGIACALTTQLRREHDRTVMAKAGVVAALLWVVGVGARLAFAFWASHGGGPAIERFSVSNSITGASAWVAAIIMMALTEVLARTIVLGVRARALQTAAPMRILA